MDTEWILKSAQKLLDFKKSIMGGAAATGSVMSEDSDAGALRDKGLTTTVLDRLPNKPLIKAETIMGETNRADVKGPEAALIRELLGDKKFVEPGWLEQAVAARVPKLGTKDTHKYADYGLEGISGDFSGVKGKPPGADHINSRSRVYTVPKDFEVSGQTHHFVGVGDGQTGKKIGDDYFAHLRSFDAPGKTMAEKPIRHIVELQSDLFQKGVKPLAPARRASAEKIIADMDALGRKTTEGKGWGTWGDLNQAATKFRLIDFKKDYDVMQDTFAPAHKVGELMVAMGARRAELTKALSRGQGMEKLAPFKKGWFERVLREENQNVLKEGSGKVRIAAPDTVEKVEGWPRMINSKETYPSIAGKAVSDLDEGVSGKASEATFTGRVQVTSEDVNHGQPGDVGFEIKHRDGSLDTYWTSEGPLAQRGVDAFDWLMDRGAFNGQTGELLKEHQGIYDFYDKDIRKFVTKEFGAKEVTDKHGNKWLEWVPKEGNVKVWGGAAAPLYLAGQKPKDMTEEGNIDIANRPKVKNADGTTSTVRSMGVNIDGKEVLLPTVSEDGKIMSDEEAIQQYKKTGKHLGKFKTEAASNAYAQKLHEQQEQQGRPAGEIKASPDRTASEAIRDTLYDSDRLRKLLPNNKLRSTVSEIPGFVGYSNPVTGLPLAATDAAQHLRRGEPGAAAVDTVLGVIPFAVPGVGKEFLKGFHSAVEKVKALRGGR